MFNNGESRLLNFEKIFKKWKIGPGDVEYSLLYKRNFEKFTLRNQTLSWPEIEIELPDDYTNVSTVRLGTYAIPSNYNTFSKSRNNILLAFQITKPYNPADYQYYDEILDIVYKALQEQNNQDIIILIREGFYTPTQLALELTNRMNLKINNLVVDYINNSTTFTPTEKTNLIAKFTVNGGYNEFIVAYNQVTQSLWFGNKSSQFVIPNDSLIYTLNPLNILNPCLQIPYKSFENFGLPSFLGFDRCPAISKPYKSKYPGDYPRFYYGDVFFTGDGGAWIEPTYKDSTIYFLEAPFKINIFGDSYIYMELAGFNNIDETLPFSLNSFTTTTNMTLGVYNSAFAKIGISAVPNSQIYATNIESIKNFNPPIERMKKIKVKLRYHNGEMVDFGKFNYSFNLVLTIFRPQQLRGSTIFDPNSGSIGTSVGIFTR